MVQSIAEQYKIDNLIKFAIDSRFAAPTLVTQPVVYPFVCDEGNKGTQVYKEIWFLAESLMKKLSLIKQDKSEFKFLIDSAHRSILFSEVTKADCQVLW